MALKKNESKWPMLSVLFVAFQFIYHVSSHNSTEGSLDLKPKGTIKTIKIDDDETIDCVDIYKQPAFDHPLIKDLQMEPSYYPFGKKLDSNLTLDMLQDWHKNGECPQGTIPIRRNKSSDNIYPKKSSFITRHQINQSLNQDNGHEYAIVSDQGSSYYGASGVFNLWNPRIENNEISLSQMWIITSYDQQDFYKNMNSIEVGWMSDGYKTKGCYNLNCQGFVQTNRKYSLDLPISRISIHGGKLREISINVFKDGDKWWLQVQGIILGYWPTVIFTDLRNNANLVQWGGEIVNQRNYGHHTTTQMGSGEFPNKGFGKSCYIRSLKVLDHGLIPRDPGYLVKTISKPACYDLTFTKNRPGSSLQTFILYGGPGFSSTCQ
ncbi:uncharacterized protein LOC124944980 [Impatiens glandulifera]|uniref:uncharacterized protein LOC124944980 n=1 Tax=Impatiens glandulifera TaxID=253017 RepID=UPI001FB0693C|nr:uncharacterized protein LOC124944980 [Impatiens glandulifera]